MRHADGPRPGPLRIRIEGAAAETFSARGRSEGFVLVGAEEEADLVALPAARPPLPAASTAARLSGRESEILEFLVDGWSNAEIASALGIGVRTVRFHLEGLYSKLGVTRRGEAVREAVRLGLARFDF